MKIDRPYITGCKITEKKAGCRSRTKNAASQRAGILAVDRSYKLSNFEDRDSDFKFRYNVSTRLRRFREAL